MAKPANVAYWQSRSEAVLLAGEQTALEYEKKLEKAYTKSIANINKDITAFYGKYAKDNEMTLAEARKALNPKELKDFQTQQKAYLEEVKSLGDKAFTAPYEKQLQQMSGRAYVTKMTELKANIQHNIETLAVGHHMGLGSTMSNAYEDGFYKTMFDIQKRAGIGVSFTQPGGKQLQAAVNENWLSGNYARSIWDDKQKLIRNLDQLLSLEFVTGKGSTDVALKLQQKMGTSLSNAKRLVRTEMNYISNKGTMKAYEESGVVDSYRYLATLDGRTSDICQDMDGRIFKLSEGEVGITLPPLHPYCRSTTIPYYPDDDIGKLIDDRVAKGVGGKTYKVGQDVNFKEWTEKHAAGAYAKRVKKDQAVYDPMRWITKTEPEVEDGIDYDKLFDTYKVPDDLQEYFNGSQRAGSKFDADGLTSLENEITNFAGGGSDIPENTKKILDGIIPFDLYNPKYEEDKAAISLLSAIDKAPKNSGNLFRIEEAGFNEVPLKAGNEFTLGVRSFSKTRLFVVDAAKGKDDMEFSDPIIYKVNKGSKSLNIEAYSSFANQEESITAGKFKIIDVEMVNYGGRKVKTVTIEQLEVKPKRRG